jgi:hypothetical protein
VAFTSVYRIRIHGKNLNILNPDLYKRVAAQSEISLTEWKQIDAATLDQTTREELVASL